MREENLDPATVAGFGYEWSKFRYNAADPSELQDLFEAYFSEFPWDELPPDAAGFDLGCGTGRWAKFVAPRIGRLHCIDASAEALEVAKANLGSQRNCSFHHASVAAIPLPDASMDFGFSLGVLHHVPDTRAALSACVRTLRPGAPFLLYLYYAMENRPAWYRGLWRGSDWLRRRLSRAPLRARYAAAQVLAFGVYWPLARIAALADELGSDVSSLPLASYRRRSFYIMRTDALDRFGTSLEQRFTRTEIASMMESCGLERISFRETAPYWCAVGHKSEL